MVDRIRYVSKKATPEQRSAFGGLLSDCDLEPDDLSPIPVGDRAVISTAVPPEVRLYLDERAAACATTRSIVIRALLTSAARKAAPRRVEPHAVSGEIEVVADGFG